MFTHPLAQVALRVHVLTGILALVAGFGAMLCTKGSTRHRRFGKLYVWLMAIVAVTSGALAASIASAFLLSLTLFIFYLALSGYSAILQGATKRSRAARPLEWCATALGLTSGASLLLLAWRSSVMERTDQAAIALVFGSIATGLGLWDGHQLLSRRRRANLWWLAHMGKMLGSYVSAVTAVVVIQAQSIPWRTRYLAPTAIGIPVIIVWMAYHWVHFRPNGPRRWHIDREDELPHHHDGARPAERAASGSAGGW